VELEEWAPVRVIGTAPNVNEAADVGFERAAEPFGMDYSEVRNRVAIAGAVEVGRPPGVARVTVPVPVKMLEELRLYGLVRKQYGLPR